MTDRRIQAFIKLGEILKDFCENRESPYTLKWGSHLNSAVETANSYNPWFTPENVKLALQSIAASLTPEALHTWFSPYRDEIINLSQQKRVGVIMAGNIPAVGFFDFMYVLISGHKIVAKLSSDDKILLPALAEILVSIEPILKEQNSFLEGKLDKIDAVIATGSNNSYRYFDYYFGKYPHILRKNRNSVAVIPTDGFLPQHGIALAKDIFHYFGLGCRNVSKIFIPSGFDITSLFPYWEPFVEVINHNKYKNNYDYYKSIFLVNGDPHFDNGFMLIKKDKENYGTPVSVLYYDEYQNVDELSSNLLNAKDRIQCIVSLPGFIGESIPFGTTQSPGLNDYADGVDVMSFLINIGM